MWYDGKTQQEELSDLKSNAKSVAGAIGLTVLAGLSAVGLDTLINKEGNSSNEPQAPGQELKVDGVLLPKFPSE